MGPFLCPYFGALLRDASEMLRPVGCTAQHKLVGSVSCSGFGSSVDRLGSIVFNQREWESLKSVHKGCFQVSSGSPGHFQMDVLLASLYEVHKDSANCSDGKWIIRIKKTISGRSWKIW
ncbi:uncharacterized protein LOC131298007 [Rhododendron vialii]|uniref:uncharacterized protein LOC131298007 n=1 Tax=Rhododendron vialii TaxID=182163 RepID=UPI00265EF967|nr:uncharacterized protein LOC131298007 [Rhododendron vialii]XP_058179256.1 uncharacterized protein LOC131298007 [Rhododendron vialii]